MSMSILKIAVLWPPFSTSSDLELMYAELYHRLTGPDQRMRVIDGPSQQARLLIGSSKREIKLGRESL